MRGAPRSIVEGGKPWNERQKDRGQQRQPHTDPEKSGVDREIQRAYGKARRVTRQHRNHRPGDDDTERGARTAKQQAFRQQRSTQGGRAGAERRANGELAFATHRAGQNQVRHIRAGDHEDQRRRRKEHEKDRPRW